MKNSLLLVFLLMGVMGFSQEMEPDSLASKSYEYNRWSVELQAGMTKPTRPMARGYAMRTPDFWQGDIGVRYMFNEDFGLKAEVGYNSFADRGYMEEFESQLIRASLQGVVNLGSVLNFRDWTQRVNLLAHGGAGYAVLKGKSPIKTDNDNMAFVVVGLTPQVRLGNHFALTGDASMYGNWRQHISFDGTRHTVHKYKRGFNGMYINVSVGLTYYIGKHAQHADWHQKVDEELENRLAKMEREWADVKDRLDGQMADLEAFLKDENENGIPDVLEKEWAQQMAQAGDGEVSNTQVVKELINNGYLSVIFPFDQVNPEPASLQSLNYVIEYMKEENGSTVLLTGYADELGNSDYNQRLSERRAERIKEVLMAFGIEGDRIEVKGAGEDSSVDKSSAEARYLIRRVVFEVK